MGRLHVRFTVDAAHAFAAATGHGFEEHRVAVRARELASFLKGDGPIGPAATGTPAAPQRSAARRIFEPMDPMDAAEGADEYDAGALARRGEFRVFTGRNP